MSKVVHGIVGWNIPEYTCNAIDSVITNRIKTEPLYVYITGGGRGEFELLRDRWSNISLVFFEYIEHDTDLVSKTGALYKGYTALFSVARNSGYEFINLMQTDMQLMWWDEEIVNHYLSLLGEFKKGIVVITDFPRKGSSPGMYKWESEGNFVSSKDQKIFYFAGHGDWGFFSINRFFEEGLVWANDETYVQRISASIGLLSLLSRVPSVAPIPWPAVIRKGKIYGVTARGNERFLLNTIPNALAFLKSSQNHEIWYEDIIRTWGWWSFEPAWATCFTLAYFRRLRITLRMHGVESIRWTRFGFADRRLPPFSNFRPRIADLVLVIVGVIYSFLHKKAPKFLRHLQGLKKLFTFY